MSLSSPSAIQPVGNPAAQRAWARVYAALLAHGRWEPDMTLPLDVAVQHIAFVADDLESRRAVLRVAAWLLAELGYGLPTTDEALLALLEPITGVL